MAHWPQSNTYSLLPIDTFRRHKMQDSVLFFHYIYSILLISKKGIKAHKKWFKK